MHSHSFNVQSPLTMETDGTPSSISSTGVTPPRASTQHAHRTHVRPRDMSSAAAAAPALSHSVHQLRTRARSAAALRGASTTTTKSQSLLPCQARRSTAMVTAAAAAGPHSTRTPGCQTGHTHYTGGHQLLLRPTYCLLSTPGVSEIAAATWTIPAVASSNDVSTCKLTQSKVSEVLSEKGQP
jgi:hypothetical protein